MRRVDFWTWLYLRKRRREQRAAGCEAKRAEFCGMSLCPRRKAQIAAARGAS